MKCKCGCGQKIAPKKWHTWASRKPPMFIFGHQRRGKKLAKETKKKISKARINQYTNEKAGNWKGGRKITKDGYVYIKKSNHPRSTVDGYVLEHHLVMEKKIDRFLRGEEVVHHEDKNKQNNDIKNLVLFKTHANHIQYHHRLRKQL